MPIRRLLKHGPSNTHSSKPAKTGKVTAAGYGKTRLGARRETLNQVHLTGHNQNVT